MLSVLVLRVEDAVLALRVEDCVMALRVVLCVLVLRVVDYELVLWVVDSVLVFRWRTHRSVGLRADTSGSAFRAGASGGASGGALRAGGGLRAGTFIVEESLLVLYVVRCVLVLRSVGLRAGVRHCCYCNTGGV
ncbi:hypothetical protein PR001_g6446 [Phytophthora rubi]|nr:hypothetical protein PR001_g6446 [Phytophthora rubi]